MELSASNRDRTRRIVTRITKHTKAVHEMRQLPITALMSPADLGIDALKIVS
jgi:hypothetical protein